MKTVHKFPIKVVDEQRIDIPEDAELLTVQYQIGVGPCLWALVDTDKPHVARKIIVHGTGHDASDVGKYVGTFQMHNGGLVFHVFDGR